MTQVKSSSLLNKLLQGLSVLLIATLFFGLGIWQLDRAKLVKAVIKESKIVDTSVVALESITVPRISLDPLLINRFVKASGNYIANFRAPNQIDGSGSESDWEVALLQVNSSAAILVVRGLWSERLVNPNIAQSMTINITGQLLGHQVSDHADNAPGVISRLDSAVIVGQNNLDLFDGFIIAKSESTQGEQLIRTRLSAQKLQSRVPGFYWQHLSYVVIWWLMAAIVLYLPFYRRRVEEA